MPSQPSILPPENPQKRSLSGPRRIPVLPVRDTVLFPHAVLPLTVGRESSIQLIESLGEERSIVVAAQLDPRLDAPKPTDLHAVGTLATVHKVVRMPNQSRFVFTEGVERVRLLRYVQTEPFMIAEVETVEDVEGETTSSVEALVRHVVGQFQQIVSESATLSDELRTIAGNIEDSSRLVDFVASSLPFLTTDDKQALLETASVPARLELLTKHLAKELEVQQLRTKIQSEVQDQVQQSQRDYYLREQMKAIQKELGEQDEGQREVEELRKKIEEAGMPEDVKKEAMKELSRLGRMSPMAADYSLTRNYIEWLAVLPWAKSSGSKIDINKAREILDEDHYELKKVKDRILDYLSVLELKPDMKGPILCFVGPPGVGKTSLGRSIARALGRKFQRISLGGMHDEAEIRGHRRTYIGALPGQIIQMMKKAGTKNPVFMLDEVDKMSMDFRGDPSAALLEVLDPEQNFMFVDHYLDVEYDLSQIFFIATANVMHTIPPALQDRMEVLRLHGYTEQEKVEIAKQFLVKKQMVQAGLTDKNIKFDDAAVTGLIRSYTREAGVRNLEREIGNVCRKVARKVVKEGESYNVTVTGENLNDFLGVTKFRDTLAHEKSEVGLVTGLAWTEVGGSILSTEATVVDGKGKLTLTGKLGDVMQESAQAAMSYVRSRALRLGLQREFYRNMDIHVHVPEGAIPKDGPSAGITIATAISSALSKIPVRRDVAMTGEITLRGKVLPIGGLKEKLLAAHRAGLFEVVLPRDNEKDLAEVPENLRSAMKMHFVDTMDQVLSIALEQPLPEQPPVADAAQPITPLAPPGEGSSAHQ